MQVQYHDVRHIVQSSVPTASKVSLEELLRTSDVVTVHVDLNEQTHHMLSTAEFNMMKEGVYVSPSKNHGQYTALIGAHRRFHSGDQRGTRTNR